MLFPEVAVLLFQLKDYDTGSGDDPLGYFSLPVATLKEGKFKLQTLGLDGKPLKDSWIKVSVRSP